MGLENLTNNSIEVIPKLVLDIGKISLWLQAIGIVSAFIILSMIINFILNRKRLKKLILINKKIEVLDKKLDKILRKRK